METPIQILIVDDQLRARQSLKALLGTCDMLMEIKEAASGEQALRSIAECRPDLVIMDIAMPQMDGLQATRLAHALCPQLKIIVLSLYSDYAVDALAAGAVDFISKGEPAYKLLATIENVLGHSNTAHTTVG